MGINHEKNLSQALLKLQEALDEIVQNTYQLGVREGFQLGLAGRLKKDDSLNDDFVTESKNELDSNKSISLLEAEKILRDYQ